MTSLVLSCCSKSGYPCYRVPTDAHLQEEMARLNVHIVPRGSIRKMSIQSTLEDKIRKAQSSDKDLMEIRMQTGENMAPDFRVDNEGTL